MQHHKYALSDIENMFPFERDVYVLLLQKYLAEERDRREREARR